MDLLELGVHGSQAFHDVAGLLPVQALRCVEPVANTWCDKRVGRRLHAARERRDVVLSEAAGGLGGTRIRMGSDLPDRRHRQSMHMTNLRQGQKRARRLVAGLERLAIDPARRLGVPLYLEVLRELFVAYCPTLAQQLLDLPQNQGVRLKRESTSSSLQALNGLPRCVGAYATVHDKAAALAHSIARNYALVDGNKRLALAALLAFYGVNGYRATMTNDSAYRLIMAIAAGHLDDVHHIAARLRSSFEAPEEVAPPPLTNGPDVDGVPASSKLAAEAFEPVQE